MFKFFSVINPFSSKDWTWITLTPNWPLLPGQPKVGPYYLKNHATDLQFLFNYRPLEPWKLKRNSSVFIHKHLMSSFNLNFDFETSVFEIWGLSRIQASENTQLRVTVFLFFHYYLPTSTTNSLELKFVQVCDCMHYIKVSSEIQREDCMVYIFMTNDSVLSF